MTSSLVAGLLGIATVTAMSGGPGLPPAPAGEAAPAPGATPASGAAPASRVALAPGAALAVPGALASGAAPASRVALASGAAPGAPGVDEQYLPADKSGLGTTTTTASRVWFTVQKEGGLGEVYYPTVGSPSTRALEFVVADRRGHAVRANAAATVRTTLIDERSLSYRQTFTERAHRWHLTTTYTSDPARSTVLINVSFTGRGYDLFTVYDPALANTRAGDSGRTAGSTLVATDGSTASALVASPAFTATSNGFRGVSDGWTDLLTDGRMDWHYQSTGDGNLVQTAAINPHTTLALGFGTPATAAATARASLRRGFGAVARDYAYGWHRYLGTLRNPPHGSDPRLYRVSVMVLAASEDKTHRGAYVAAPAMPWAFGRDDPSGPYHLVWSRDLYQIATALIAAGDVAGAGRALDFLFGAQQQQPDGSFPQNSQVDGTPVWGGLQLDEVALPIVLAGQLHRTGPSTWQHVRRAADFLTGFTQDGNRAPWSPQERWENQSGYSPATIAAGIAGLVCAADIARANGDPAAAQRYLATADDWRAHVKDWTVTSTGPYSPKPYFLRLTKDGNPDAGTTYTIGDSGPSDVDQRRVVDPSFLDLVRLGVLPPDDPAVVNSTHVVDAQLGVPTARGFFWHRASFDGYGEKLDGSQWDYGFPDDSLITRGRAWPLLNGERGEYDLARGHVGAARAQLATMARSAGPGSLLPEQVWDNQGPGVPGTPTFSATPLAWTHAQYVRLAVDTAAGRVLEQPAVVAKRYLRPGG
ncbi:glycoside hydrolase family 15 protein [Actinoplanes sp. N902-109]|uniref:glycoside hydrolase family 15 protein n=1 Tax=Actinoplanes sp. (strain N902-109) TaxID=649831 RepID=UPI0003295FD7|nr:glycoside hydrolase family 15 protein [Actinoplanes sp. N902-109]AGL17143.1 glucan 1,4-alpha-glucosidase [Actinoplanes sp. N902-109]